jgi:hypothetical protein
LLFVVFLAPSAKYRPRVKAWYLALSLNKKFAEGATQKIAQKPRRGCKPRRGMLGFSAYAWLFLI